MEPVVLVLNSVVGPQVNLARSSSSSSGNSDNPLHDPYYLLPNENSSVISINKPLVRSNYHLWSWAMRMALKSKNKLNFIDGSIKKLNEEDASFSGMGSC